MSTRKFYSRRSFHLRAVILSRRYVCTTVEERTFKPYVLIIVFEP
jgi:hypothetical protein